jgi:preprotein translocase SecE subunit
VAGSGAGELLSGELVRADLPAALTHASADVDEFDAALVRGAAGVERPLRDDEELGEGAPDEGSLRPSDHTSHRSATSRSDGGRPGSRAIAFLRASWAELQRVQWPDRPEVWQATAVVLGFVLVAGIYLGLADWVAEHIIKLIL